MAYKNSLTDFENFTLEKIKCYKDRLKVADMQNYRTEEKLATLQNTAVTAEGRELYNILYK